jgi:lantibiotic modifying enzyme
MKNWLDMRDDAVQATLADGRPRCMTTWCHGAPGIGLARLQTLAYWDDDKDEIYTEIETALNTTLVRGFGLGHSLCHGDLGNLETLLQASNILNDVRWSQEVARLGSLVIVSIEQHSWVCGVPLGVETPGLMTGLAGIGYGLLRLADFARVPSVLVLEPPRN